MSTKRFIIQNVILVIVVTGSLFTYKFFFEKKVAMVNLGEVYKKFEYTSVMEKKAELTMNARNNILDSMKLDLETDYRRIKSMANSSDEIKKAEVEQFTIKRQEFLDRKGSFEKSNTEMMEQYEKQIWTQINKYIEDYGKEKGVGIIVGGNGSGNVMYSDDSFDLTEDVVAYINSKYKGIDN